MQGKRVIVFVTNSSCSHMSLGYDVVYGTCIEEQEDTYIILLDGGDIVERSKEFVEEWDEWE